MGSKVFFVAAALVMMVTRAGAAQNIKRMPTPDTMSIFSRYRNAAAGEADGGVVTAAPVFFGVVKSDAGYVALLQSRTAGGGTEVIRVRPGDTLEWDQSTVREVTWDSLQLSGGSQAQSVVAIGNDLRNSSVPSAGPAVLAQPRRLGPTGVRRSVGVPGAVSRNATPVRAFDPFLGRGRGLGNVMQSGSTATSPAEDAAEAIVPLDSHVGTGTDFKGGQ